MHIDEYAQGLLDRINQDERKQDADGSWSGGYGPPANYCNVGDLLCLAEATRDAYRVLKDLDTDAAKAWIKRFGGKD